MTDKKEEEKKSGDKNMGGGSNGTGASASNKKPSQMVQIVGSISEYTPGDNFESYAERLEQYMIVNAFDEAKKVAILICSIGAAAYELLRKLVLPRKVTQFSYEELIKLLRGHYVDRVNTCIQRYKFEKTNQSVGQSLNDYIVEIKEAAKTCGFADGLQCQQDIDLVLNDNLKHRFIFGLCDANLRERLLCKNPPTFEKCVESALSYEAAKLDNQVFNSTDFVNFNSEKRKENNYSGSKSSNVKFNYNKNEKYNNKKGSSNRQFGNNYASRKNNYKKSRDCMRCGESHPNRECPAMQYECYACKKKGHLARCCRSKVQMINSFSSVTQPAHIQIEVESKTIEMELDTGASNTIISLVKFNKYFDSKVVLSKANKKLYTLIGNLIVKGESLVMVKWNGAFHRLKLIVVDTATDFSPLLGRDWLDVLFPDWRARFSSSILKVGTFPCGIGDETVSQMKNQYPNVFSQDKNDCIKNYIAEIHLKESARPLFHKAYTVPHKLKDKVEKELEILVNENCLIPVTHSEFASPIVAVPKPDGNIRICIDCKLTVNNQIKLEHYPLPNIMDIFAGLANCKIFCKLDLKGAYQQIRLSPESQKILTINTHKGLFQYTRLPFGVASAPSIFQSVMDRILLNIPNVFCYLDDILIGGEKEIECRRNLYQVLERLNEHSVKINVDKCSFFVKSVEYLGHVLSEGEMKPNTKKLDALMKSSPPTNVKQLQSFIGLVNYYGKFVPKLADNLKNLYKLLRKDVKF